MGILSTLKLTWPRHIYIKIYRGLIQGWMGCCGLKQSAKEEQIIDLKKKPQIILMIHGNSVIKKKWKSHQIKHAKVITQPGWFCTTKSFFFYSPFLTAQFVFIARHEKLSCAVCAYSTERENGLSLTLGSVWLIILTVSPIFPLMAKQGNSWIKEW